MTATVWTVRTDAPSDAPRRQLLGHLVSDTPSLTQDDYVRLTTASLGVLGCIIASTRLERSKWNVAFQRRI